MVSPLRHGYMHCPDTYNQRHIDAWRLVTEALHQAGDISLLRGGNDGTQT